MTKAQTTASSDDPASAREVFCEFLRRFPNRSEAMLALGLSRQQVSNFATGAQGRRPSKETAERIARITGGEIPAEWVREGRPSAADRCVTCGRRLTS